MRYAIRRGVLDHPGPGKVHARAVPYLGGVAIVVSFAVGVGAVAVAWEPSGANLGVLVVTLGLGVVLAGLGLLDDLRNLPILPRLVVEVLAALIVYASGTRAAPAGAPRIVDLVVTVVWIVGVTNAFNLLDNLDGLSAGVAALAALAVAGIGLTNDQFFVPLLGFALAGGAAGFLWHNFHPARIHMGDAGSLFLGFVLAVLALRLRAHVAHQVSLAVPLIALAVPVFDTTLVVSTRAWHRRNPFRGGPDHVSHRLVCLGCSVRQAVTVIYLAAAVCGGTAILLTRTDRVVARAAVGALLLLAAAAGVRLARVPMYPVDDAVPGPAQPPAGQRRSTS